MPPSSPASLRHRRSFWIGIGTLILLTAAWVHSIGRKTSFTRYATDYYLSVRHSEGLLTIGSGQHIFGMAFPKWGITNWQFNEPLNTGSLGLQLPQVYKECFGPWFAFIPYWFVLTLFLLTWLPFLIWRTRTIRKHLNERPPLPFLPQS